LLVTGFCGEVTLFCYFNLPVFSRSILQQLFPVYGNRILRLQCQGKNAAIIPKRNDISMYLFIYRQKYPYAMACFVTYITKQPIA
jgi:hypothetical protein